MTGPGPDTGSDRDSALLRPKENALPAALKESGFDSGIGGVGKL